MCIVRERHPAGFLDMKCQTCFSVSTAQRRIKALMKGMAEAEGDEVWCVCVCGFHGYCHVITTVVVVSSYLL